ncbi:MAG: 2-dehydropantoate 2-reductase [Alphaproteobacteria bacterium]|nr:2-dehydropantoate 2-reductase [Alphaproteobacteria bacterium]
MRLLILGAGGVGGYFGGRLVQAGADVTFLVRPPRAEQLRRTGLMIESPKGGFTTPVTTATLARDEDWSLILLSAKAYDLDAAIEAIAPAVGPRTHVLPLLNGLAHMDVLDARFGAERVLGGIAYIAATLTAEGVVRHLNAVHRLDYGARGGKHPESLHALSAAFAKSAAEGNLVDDPLQVLWDKWVRLAPLAALTCLLRGPVGRIVATEDGADLMHRCIAEAAAVAAASGHPTPTGVLRSIEKSLTEPGSSFAASMMRDIERGGPTEGAHVLGDIVRRAARLGVETPIRRIAWTHLQVYEAGRAGA